MDEKYIQDHDLVSRYRRGLLSPEETIEFENYFLDKPQLLEQLEADWLIASGIKEDRVAESSKGRGPFAMAASIAALGLVATIGYALHLSQELRSTQQGIANVPSLSLDVTRSASSQNENIEFSDTPNVLNMDSDAPFAILTLMTALSDVSEYEVRILRHPEQSEIISYENVHAKGAGDLVISVPSSLLTQGDYVVEMVSSSGNVIVPLRVTKRD